MNLRNVLHSVLIHLFSRYESHEIISSNTSNTPVKGMMLRAGQLKGVAPQSLDRECRKLTGRYSMNHILSTLYLYLAQDVISHKWDEPLDLGCQVENEELIHERSLNF